MKRGKATLEGMLADIYSEMWWCTLRKYRVEIAADLRAQCKGIMVLTGVSREFIHMLAYRIETLNDHDAMSWFAQNATLLDEGDVHEKRFAVLSAVLDA